MALEREITEKEELLVGFLDCITAIGKTVAWANERYETEKDRFGNKMCDYDKFWVQRKAVLNIADSLNVNMWQQIERAIELLVDERALSDYRRKKGASNEKLFDEHRKVVEEEYSLAREEIQVRGFVDRTEGGE